MLRLPAGLLLATVLLVGEAGRARAGLIINTNLLAGTAPTTTGTGTLQSVFESAAQVWENIFSSNSFTHTLSLNYGWGVQSGSTLAAHSLTGEGGTPHRETSGQIIFDNDGSSLFFLDGSLDPFNPTGSGNSEYTVGMTTSSQDFGGGTMNTSRRFSGATGAAASRSDLFSVALHEIGHALGMSSANNAYAAESWPDNDVDISGLFAFAGSALPTNNGATPETGATSNSHLNISNALLFPSIGTGLRRLPSEADILANAQISLFTNPILNLDFSSIPEPGSFALALTAVVAALARSKRNRGYRLQNRDREGAGDVISVANSPGR